MAPGPRASGLTCGRRSCATSPPWRGPAPPDAPRPSVPTAPGRVAKLADAEGLNPSGAPAPCGFDPRPGHRRGRSGKRLDIGSPASCDRLNGWLRTVAGIQHHGSMTGRIYSVGYEGLTVDALIE